MANKLLKITPKLEEFILAQKMFFVGTAADEGRVNLSPKGLDSLRVIGPNKIIWLNLTGSGNETAAHLIKNNRMTIMLCSFEGNPLILRLYGIAKIFHTRDEMYHEYSALFPKYNSARQIIEMDVDLVQTSCGFAVPFMDFKEERTLLTSWAHNRDEEQIKKYWQEKNSLSIDGFETGIF